MPKKRPTCPIYFNDILGSCKTWTDEEFGAYMRLLLEQWDKGFIPNPSQTDATIDAKANPNAPDLDFQRLLMISPTAQKNWKLLSKKFKISEEGLYNQRMEDVRNELDAHEKKQSDNANKRWKKMPNLSQTYAKSMPLEDENEDENGCLEGESMRGEEENPLTKILPLNPIGKNDKVTNEMRAIYKEYFPDDPENLQADHRACRLIAVYLNGVFKWEQNAFETHKCQELLQYWRQLVFYATLDTFYRKIELARMDGHIRGLIKSFKASFKTNGHAKNIGHNPGIGKEFTSSPL